VVATAGGFYWLIHVVRAFAGLPWSVAVLAWLVFCSYQGVTFLLFGWFVHSIRSRRALPMAWLAPLAAVSAEFVMPALFPWHLAITQAWHPLIIQIADLGGPLGVTALLVLINGATYDLWTRRRDGRYPALAAALVFAAAIAYGYLRLNQFDRLAHVAPKLQVGVVQPNFAYRSDGVIIPAEAARQLATLQTETRVLSAAGAQLVIWSEGSYPLPVARDMAADFAAESPRAVRRGFATPLLIGAMTVERATSIRLFGS
jgi:apolipoprotein N-acyltransferase